MRGYAATTRTIYVNWVKDLARFRKASPDQIPDEQIREYLLHLLRVRRLATGTLMVAVSALRFFYGRVIGRPTEAIEKALPRMKKRVRRPQVYSNEELERLFGLEDLNRKHRAIFMTTYAAGLRVSEVTHLKIDHLLSDRGQIRVVQGKGGKDRYTLLSPRLLEELRAYWRLYRPAQWLFPSSHFPDRPLTRQAVERAFNHGLEMAGLPRRGGVHALRHTFATRLLEGGVDLLTLQRLLGHSQFASTAGYLHVRQERITGISSALDLIDFERARKSDGSRQPSLRVMSAPATGAPGSPTLASVLRCALPAYTQSHRLPAHHWKVLRAIQACRTPDLGGHLYQCPHCRAEHFVPHSCRNRHCPTCQGANSVDWLEKQAQALLPIPYFHLVFTLPHDLNALIQHNQAALYGLLFAAASATLVEFGHSRLQARIGVTAVLHTWSQTLLDHYHLHCIVTGGGLAMDTEGWRAVNSRWLFPVRALSVVFRAKFREGLEALHQRGELRFGGCVEPLASPAKFRRLVRQACRQKWVVYANRPFAGPEAVLGYLSRYTHRVGITNRRLLSLDAGGRTVRFAYKDYADDARRKVMNLGLEEFVRRFCLHILPPRFVKIRHDGILSTRNRSRCVQQARTALGVQGGSNATAAAVAVPPAEPSAPAEPPASTLQCPHCQKPGLILIRVVRPPRRARPPPDDTS